MISSNDLNGRINILGENSHQFEFADKIPLKETTCYNTALRGSWTDTPLSTLFFSKENISRRSKGRKLLNLQQHLSVIQYIY